MNLSKTENLILDELQQTQKPLGFCQMFGRGKEGGRILEGARKYRAARKLVERGVCQLLKEETWTSEGPMTHMTIKISLQNS